MISFFRRALSSWLVLGLLGLIMVAFIVTGVGTPSGLGVLSGATSATTAAKVGKETISVDALETRVRRELAAQAQQSQGLDMPTFVAAGGVEHVLDQYVSGTAMAAYARDQGVAASKRLVDGEIASISAFNGPSGKFDEATFKAVIAQQRLTEAELRTELGGDAIRRMLIAPMAAAAKAPTGLAAPYASLLLEKREGEVAVVPATLLGGGAPPSEAELQAFYTRHIAAYTLPERRVLRFAIFGRDQVAAKAVPSEADVAGFYAANKASYAAKEERDMSQVVLDSEAKANDLAAKVKAGTSFAAAAQAAGFAPADTKVAAKKQADLAKLASPAVAAAAFAAPSGGISAPAKSDFGWHVVHIEAIRSTPERTLAAAHAEIAANLAVQKQDEALADLAQSIEDAIDKGANFDEVVKDKGLTITATPPVLASGSAPDEPTYKPDPALGILLKPAFEMTSDAAPVVQTIGKGERYALLSVQRVLPPAPLPLAKVHDRVAADFATERGLARAQAVAAAIAAKASAGVSLADAVTQAGLKLPGAQPVATSRLELSRAGDNAPPPLALLFTLKAGAARAMAAPGGQGWYVVKLDRITPQNAAGTPALVEATRGQLDRVIGEEYVEQFAAAARAAVGVTINAKAVAGLKARLAGAATAQP